MAFYNHFLKDEFQASIKEVSNIYIYRPELVLCINKKNTLLYHYEYNVHVPHIRKIIPLVEEPLCDDGANAQTSYPIFGPYYHDFRFSQSCVCV